MPLRKPVAEIAPPSRRLEDLDEDAAWRAKRAEREAREEREHAKDDRRGKPS